MVNFLDIPSDPAPTGLQIFAIFINFFFPSVALVVVTTRAAGRLAVNQFGWDDWLVCVAMLLSVAETVVSYFFIKTNFVGIHLADIPPHDPTEALIWSYAVQILYNPILALVKSSVLLFLLRLFGQKSDGVRRFIIGLNIVNIAQMVGVFFAITFQCFPIAFNWDRTIPGGRCVDQRILYTCTSVFNIFTDLLVLGLPLWIFVDLKIPQRTKVALLFVFLLGFIVTITSIIRLVILVQGLFGLVVVSDPTFNIGFVTSAIETNLALITASAPALRPIFRSRDRGGWFARQSTMASRRGTMPDLEAGQMKSVGWSDQPLPPNGKLGRGGSRSGRRGSGRSTRSGRGGHTKRAVIRVRGDAAELRSQSPRSSEEETMTSNGIMRVSDVQREIDGIVKDITVSGEGSYTGIGVARTSNEVVARASRSLTPRSRYAERFYSESVYPDLDFDRRTERDYNEERISKYGDKRFGVVTPHGTTPTTKTWAENGRPF